MEGRPTLRTIAVINQKGGCGKTTTSINLAASLASMGQRTLLIDVDPQGHCALGLAVPEKQLELSVADVFLSTDPTPAAFEPLFWQVAANLDLAPATVSLAGVERRLADAPDRDLRLARFLASLGKRYDVVLVDCPPSIGLLTFNALRAAQEVIIPVETGYFALKGAAKQVATIRVMSEQCGHGVAIHVLPTMYDVRQKLGREILNDLKRQFGQAVLPIVIHYNSKLKEAASFGQPITEYDPSSRGRQDFDALARHLIGHEPDPSRAEPRTHADPADVEQMGANGSMMAPVERAVQSAAASAACRVEEATLSAATAAAPPAATGRAAELVQRARALAARTARLNERLQAANAASTPSAATPPADPQQRREQLDRKLQRLYGVRQTGAGVLFVQPLEGASRVNVAGDFNNWCTRGSDLKPNEHLGVWELCVPLAPGRYRYRLVVDGRWMTDPHNTHVETNPFGELNNIIEVQ